MEIVKLFDEVSQMEALKDQTVVLIHSTSLIPAIKKLVNAYDIIDLNLEIEKKYKYYKDQPPWDLAALDDLNRLRRELVVYHAKDFRPKKLLDKYSNKMTDLFRVVKRRRKLEDA